MGFGLSAVTRLPFVNQAFAISSAHRSSRKVGHFLIKCAGGVDPLFQNPPSLRYCHAMPATFRQAKALGLAKWLENRGSLATGAEELVH